MAGNGTAVPYVGTASRTATTATSSSAEKVLQVLASFRERPRWGITALADAVAMPKSTVHRLVGTLCRTGFLQQDPVRGDYTLGPAAWALAGRTHESDTLVDIAMPTLERLRAETGETTFLTVREGARSRCVARINAEHGVAVLIRQGAAHPLHLGASNTVLLAFLSEPEQRAYLESQVVDPQARTRVQQRLDAVAASGYAYSASELTQGAAAIGVPVLGSAGQVIAGLSIGAPEYRFSRDRALSLLTTLQAAGRYLSRRFGYATEHDRFP